MAFDANFYTTLAARLADDFQPRTVLGPMELVAPLRAQGIQADTLSEPLSGPPPGRYDLIVCLELLEHLPRTEAEQAIANLCQSTDDILFSSTPFDFKEISHINVRPLDDWAIQFARHGFFHDVDYDGSYLTPWTLRFRRGRGEAVGRVVGAYERRLWWLVQENTARRELNIELRNELALKAQAERYQDLFQKQEQELQKQEQELQRLKEQLAAWELRWSQLEASMGGRVLQGLQNLRAWIAPPRSIRDQVLENFVQRVVLRGRIAPGAAARLMRVEPIGERPPVPAHAATVDIVVCVHNALDDARRCLESVVQHSTPPYALILVDDGSEAPTRDFLIEFAAQQHATLLRNEAACGYGYAANQGLRATTADYVILLNSDTVVTAEWLDRLVECGESNDLIGLMGPLSNTASWQSIPELEDHGDWAANPLPEGVSIEQLGQWVAQYSARLYPPLPFLNGFCYGIKRAVIDRIGYFDEANFGAGYGEENDFTLRARKAGYQVAIADDVYVHHNQSRSYSHEKRRALSEQAGQTLARKHGQEMIDQGVAVCQFSPVMLGVRARSRVMPEREKVLRQGRERYQGKRLLFVLPIQEPAGGGNVVIDEALLMRRMGVEVSLFNLTQHQARFERAYPNLELPVIYASPAQLLELSRKFDAIIATFNTSVEWLLPLAQQDDHPMLGYYVQDFEPYMYQAGTPEYQRALKSYTLFPQLKLFTKTEWTRQEVLKITGADCAPIGVSLNIDLFRPRPPVDPVWPGRPLRVAAMVRPASPYRSPKLTMELLRDMVRRYGSQVEAVIFGVAENDPAFNGLPRDFPYTLAGVLSQKQVARLLNEVDVFVDVSTYQAMGLTALEAMACGTAVIVPAHGGATSFARHGENSLVVATDSRRACQRALQQLIDDHDLRRRLQQRTLQDVCAFFSERPASRILEVLFGGKPA